MDKASISADSRPASLVRHYVRSRFGLERVRVQRNGDVRVFGVMPKSGIRGWYLFGTVHELIEAATEHATNGRSRLGRPRTREARGSRYDVYLYESDVAALRRIGNGNLSQAIRLTLNAYMAANSAGDTGFDADRRGEATR